MTIQSSLLLKTGKPTAAPLIVHPQAGVKKTAQKTPKPSGIIINNVATEGKLVDRLHVKARKVLCDHAVCKVGIVGEKCNIRVRDRIEKKPREMVKEVQEFFEEYFESINKLDHPEHWARVVEVLASLKTSGNYELTSEELTFGATQAWRNASWSLDRLEWQQLRVFDQRHVTTAQEMFKALCLHLEYVTNNGYIRPAISVFPPRVAGKPDFRIWNEKLIAYAGYQQEDGEVIGDPENLSFTQFCHQLGWKGPGTAFDILPLVLNVSGGDPEIFEIPRHLVLQVKITHPDYPWFEELGLQWFAVSSRANMMLNIAGIEYPAAPISGWFTNDEIGARAFCDPQRYNILPFVADKLGVDTLTPISFWKDEALIEVNVAVVSSFRKSGVRLVDHHTAAALFVKYLQREQKLRGGCPADWAKVVPSISSSLTPTFHQEMLNYTIQPAFEIQEQAWKCHEWIDKEKEILVKGQKRRLRFKTFAKIIGLFASVGRCLLNRRVKATILFASETGRSENYARRLVGKFNQAFSVEVICMKDYDFSRLMKEQLLLIVTSTFGSGEAPDNGKKFSKCIETLSDALNNNNEVKAQQSKAILDMLAKQPLKELMKIRYAVFALGSTAYPDFCQFGRFCDETLQSLGCERLSCLATADELKGQDAAYRKWAPAIFKKACEEFKLTNITDDAENEEQWRPENFRLRKVKGFSTNLQQSLNKLHGRQFVPFHLKQRTQLQSIKSSRQTALVELIPENPRHAEYEPGDHLGVMPVNCTENVEALVNKLATYELLTLNDVIQLETNSGSLPGKWAPVSRLPPCSMFTALTSFLDITSPPTQEFLAHLAMYAFGEEDKKKLNRLIQEDEHYEEWKSYKYPSLLEVLEEFPSVKPDASLLLAQLPLLQPRYYSISSSPLATPGEIHLTVGVVKYHTLDGTGSLHHGLCSNYLNDLKNKENIYCFVRRANGFHLPKNKTSPLVLIGAGTGIAPFRGFWDQRRCEKESQLKRLLPDDISSRLNEEGKGEIVGFGDVAVYFGCRHAELDNLYETDRIYLLETGDINSNKTAFSRMEGKKKTYVQHLVSEDAQKIYDYIIHRSGHIYVCGEATMAAGVRKTLLQILKTCGNMTDGELANTLLKIKAENRYHEDIYGILERRS